MLIANLRKFNLSATELLRSTVVSQYINRHSSYESRKFPNYHVIYSLDTVKNVSIINRMKLNTTVFSGIIIPLVKGLEVMNIVNYDLADSFIIFGFTAAVFFHALGFFGNNVVGYIYAKPNSDDLKISYVNYWGKRVDIDTSFSDITCIEQNSRIGPSIFHTLKVDNLKKSLKLYVKGKVLDETKYHKLFGIAF